MDFGTNKTLAINKKGEFEGTYFRDIYIGKEIHGKNLMS